MKETMKASVLHAPKDIRYEDVPVPEIGPNDVLIKVAYAGICGSDLPRSNNENGARMYPLILGHEFSGYVEKLGENVTDYQIGEPVAIAPLIPDPNNIYTKEGIYGLSDNYNIIGTGSNGGFAEYCKVPASHLVKLPEGMDLETAAGIEPAAIAYHAMNRSEIKAGDVVAVLGCGSIGQFTIQCAKLFGASKIIAVDIFDDKLEFAKTIGATHSINSKEENLLEKIHKITGEGVDVVMETAGSSITQKQSFMITRKRGRIVFVGISHRELNLTAEEAERILRAELTLKGSWNSYTAPYPGRAWTGSVDAMHKGDIIFKPMISHRIPLSELGEYLVGMSEHTIDFNKVVVDFSLDE